MSPRTGRPFAGETRKDTTVKVRMDEKELRQLDTCTEKLGISQSYISRLEKRILMQLKATLTSVKGK